ncbi:60S ribosomal subunit assembly or modification protein [Malassezia sp. CBS 17886]|nr:60S ribosomal subunit assembly or modification protein [Malassezia sp. CBS 17886]
MQEENQMDATAVAEGPTDLRILNEDVEFDATEGVDEVPMDGDDGDDGDDGHEVHDEEFRDDSIAAFYDHRKSVFCVQLHPLFPHPPIVVTGGEDDGAWLWNAIDGSPLARLSGHTDSVVAVAFSVDGEFVATGGLDGRVRVWRRRGDGDAWDKWEFLTNLEGPAEIVWLSWHPKGPVLVAGRKLVSGSDDGSLIVWDPRSAAPLAKLGEDDARFSLEGGVTSLCISADSRLVAVGGAAGGVRVLSAANLDAGGAAVVVGVLDGHDAGESVESVEFIDLVAAGAPGPFSGPTAASSSHLVSGGTDGRAIVWDLATGARRGEAMHDAAVTKVIVHPKTPLFTTSSTDHGIRTWDARTLQLLGQQHGFTDGVLDVAVGVDDGLTQGAETGGVGKYADGQSKGYKIVGAGDEGVALVFRLV